MTPYEAVYGVQSPRLMTHILETTRVQAIEEELKSRDQILQTSKENLVLAEGRMKQMADLHQTKRDFLVKDWVLLELQPYRQRLVATRRSQKFSPKVFGPCQILKRVDPVTYKLQLLAESRIHLVFLVS